jgi:hypothetical protein
LRRDHLGKEPVKIEYPRQINQNVDAVDLVIRGQAQHFLVLGFCLMMILHRDKELFTDAINASAKMFSIRPIYAA